MTIPKEFGRFLQDGIQKLISEKKWRIVLVCSAGGAVLLILIVALLSVNSGKGARSVKASVTADDSGRQLAVSSEELFLPDEPDFVPGVLSGRERRTAWTVQDAAAYWRDPLKSGEEEWREKVEAVIDKFLENVP